MAHHHLDFHDSELEGQLDEGTTLTAPDDWLKVPVAGAEGKEGTKDTLVNPCLCIM